MSERLQPTPAQLPQHEAGTLRDGVSTAALFAAWRRRWKLVGGTVLLSTCAVAAVVVRGEPSYRATAVLRVADTRQAVSAAIDLPQASAAADRRFDPVFSQLHLLQSRTVLAQVVETEGLRLEAVSAELSVDRLRNLHIDPAATADSLWVSFSATGFGARTHGAAGAAAYGAPLTVAGISFTVDARPSVGHATFAVLPQEAAVDRVRKRRSSTSVTRLRHRWRRSAW
jgi:hypothetical protein